MLNTDTDPIDSRFNRDFAAVFGEEPSRTVIADPTNAIAESQAQEEQNLDPASQTGDFVLPSPKPPKKEKIFDLTHEEVRIYHFADGVEIEVANPIQLTIEPNGDHNITPNDRVGIVVPYGWIKIEVFPKHGEACFPGHDTFGFAD